MSQPPEYPGHHSADPQGGSHSPSGYPPPPPPGYGAPPPPPPGYGAQPPSYGAPHSNLGTASRKAATRLRATVPRRPRHPAMANTAANPAVGRPAATRNRATAASSRSVWAMRSAGPGTGSPRTSPRSWSRYCSTSWGWASSAV
ncbi:hypothetical protein GAN18_10710 [Mycobacterium kubicae]|nr:hypothetical protein GAN18_10710 [Mycobacterium kubicae]